MNQVEYECDVCHYHEAIHGQNGFFITDERFKKCSHCTKPTRERLAGHGIYPPNEGGFTIKEG